MSLSEQRYQQILTLLSQNTTMRTSELAILLNVSEMTARRDLLILEKQGLLKRIHGGAMSTQMAKDTYSLRNQDATQEKKTIAHHVVNHLISVLENKTTPQAIYLDSGTTLMAVAKTLCQKQLIPPLTLVTHSTNIASTLVEQMQSHRSRHRLHMIGGEIYQNTYSTFGEDALNAINRFKFDYLFLGASGFDDTCFTNINYVEIALKRALIRQSKEIWVMLDSSKWQQANFAMICGYSDIHKLFLGPDEHPQKTRIQANYPHLQLFHCN